MEKNADYLDSASDLEEVERASSIEAQRKKNKPQQVRDAEGLWPHEECLACGNEIGEARLEATGSVLCVDCKNIAEVKGKNYAT